MNEIPPASPDYHDIPGTFVFDGAQSRKGYRLNMFCMSLNDERNRSAFRAGDTDLGAADAKERSARASDKRSK